MQDNESQFRSQATIELSGVERTRKTIANKTPGGVVQPGTPLAEVVSLEDTLLVEARIRPQDIAFVSVGQKAIVKFATYDYSIYGGVEGRIVHLSTDSIQPQAQSGQSSEPYYISHVRTLKAGIEHRGKVLPVIPGMTGRRSVLYYLVKPINKTVERSLTER